MMDDAGKLVFTFEGIILIGTDCQLIVAEYRIFDHSAMLHLSRPAIISTYRDILAEDHPRAFNHTRIQ
jgi:hypothetical protein